MAKEFGLTIVPDPVPNAGHYYRSDHFSLARVGVPAFSIGEGDLYKDTTAPWGSEGEANSSRTTIITPATNITRRWTSPATP